ncbi:hypothetical protein CVT24_005986 [Panaeolus cyanescens]|uniref:Major facilitator superfamily (MFS) profile domain-containing protein n=1 Tax=Panaeolus cyanescens TaxID=181874 RepID=A0A409VDI9_9AGAR|nr:hypothetical protein CVT24_005986 [Panaeolus cyanescens]
MDNSAPSTPTSTPATGTRNDVLSDDERPGGITGLPQEQVEEITKLALRRADFRLLPLLGMLNALSLIDRSNLGLARTAGMGKDLSLGIGARYSIVSCIYFIPYILLELPSNLFLRRLGVVNWLTFLAISWGTVQLAMGFVTTWKHLMLCRVLLGAFEAGFFPALVYIVTSWYTRHEVQKRLAALYIVGVFVGGFSAIFAYVLTLLNGKQGIAGWSWIFIVEGAITIGFGILGWFYLPTFPEQNTFLTTIETSIVLNRVEKDRGDSVPDDISTGKVIAHLSDWKIWVFGVMYMCTTMPSYAISFFLTLILRGMGWSTTASLLLVGQQRQGGAIQGFSSPRLDLEDVSPGYLHTVPPFPFHSNSTRVMSADSFTSDIKKEKDVSKDSSVSSVKIESGSSGYDAVFEKRTLRYLDWRILPILALAYSFALIDRINLGAAYAAGMDADLGLRHGSRYSIISCIYFVPYFFLQLPGNLVLRYFGVRNWLSFVIVAWGSVQLGMGFVHQWGWLVLCRALLGVFEASFFPALVFIISTWYKRHEVQKRLAIFYLLSITAGGLSPLLAYVLSLLDGKGNLAGWRWIFVIEGIITILLAGITYLFIPEFPDQNRFLTKEQTEFVLKRIDEDRGDALPDEITWAKVLLHLRDWTIWGYGTIFLLASLPSYAQGFFLPIILKGMGWSKTASLLLASFSVPPYGPTIITTMVMAHYADKYKHRSGFIAGCTIVCLIGLTLTAFAKQDAVRYFGCFLINAGNSGSGPSILAYSVNNVVSHSKRSVVTALTISLSSIGGIIATTVFRAADFPRYVPGMYFLFHDVIWDVTLTITIRFGCIHCGTIFDFGSFGCYDLSLLHPK